MTQSPVTAEPFVQSLARGLAVIRCFDAEHHSMTLSEVSARTGLSRAAARRFLHTLLDLGYVRSDGKQFELTAQVLQLGYAFLAGQSLPQLIQPLLEELSSEFQESASAAVLDGDDIVYVARTHMRRIMTIGITVGTRFPAYATSMGRVLLAGLPPAELEEYLARVDLRPLTARTVRTTAELRAKLAEVRSQGFALVDQELEAGLRSIAVPVYRPDGSVAAALNMSMQEPMGGAEAPGRKSVRHVVPRLQEASARVTETLTALG